MIDFNMWSAFFRAVTGCVSKIFPFGKGRCLTVVNPLQPFLQPLEVELPVSCRVELPPQLLDALVALVLWLHLRPEI